MKKVNIAWFPLALCLMLVVVLGFMLPRDRSPQVDLSLNDGYLPGFILPNLYDGEDITQDDVFGELTLVNVWASWCAPCRIEHPVLVSIAENYDIPILGVNFRDDHDEAMTWLQEHKDPFTWNLADYNGKLAFDWGILGVPTTYLIEPDGKIAFAFPGILTETIWEEEFLPIIEANSAS
jgi:cytochrome c biogenesis protein CcmG/thiol:disulfide interchange protein DsbE